MGMAFAKVIGQITGAAIPVYAGSLTHVKTIFFIYRVKAAEKRPA